MSSVRQKRAEVHKTEARAAEKLRAEGGSISDKIDKLVEDVESTPAPKATVAAKKPAKKKAAPKAKSTKKSK